MSDVSDLLDKSLKLLPSLCFLLIKTTKAKKEKGEKKKGHKRIEDLAKANGYSKADMYLDLISPSQSLILLPQNVDYAQTLCYYHQCLFMARELEADEE